MRVSLLRGHVFALLSLTAAEDCFQTGISWSPIMDNQDVVTRQDAAECQKHCEDLKDHVPGCQHFSFWPDDLQCKVHDGNATQQDDTKAVSGGIECDPACDFVYGHMYVKSANDTTSSLGDKTNADSVDECQETCQNTPNCTSFGYWWNDGGCWLQDDSMTTLVISANAKTVVSGPRVCNETAPTPAPVMPTPAPPTPVPPTPRCESAPCGTMGETEQLGAADTVDSIQTWALRAVTLPSWSPGGVAVGFGAVTVAFGGLVAALRTWRDSSQGPVIEEENLLVE